MVISALDLMDWLIQPSCHTAFGVTSCTAKSLKLRTKFPRPLGSQGLSAKYVPPSRGNHVKLGDRPSSYCCCQGAPGGSSCFTSNHSFLASNQSQLQWLTTDIKQWWPWFPLSQPFPWLCKHLIPVSTPSCLKYLEQEFLFIEMNPDWFTNGWFM